METGKLTNNEKRTRNFYLDLFKFFLCYLVICIHLSGENHPWFPLYRLAVPSFFLISGYFLYTADKEKAKSNAKRFIFRSFRYLLIGFAINISFDFVRCFHDGIGVGYFFTTLFYEDFLLEFLILNRPVSYVGAQLWFLIALFVLSLLHYLLARFEKLHWYKFLVPVCFVIYFFFSAFMYFLQDTDIPIRYMRNALFFGLPNFGLGYLVAKLNFHKKPWQKYLYLALGILFFFLQIGEHALLHTERERLEMYASGVISGVCFLQFFLGIKEADCPFFYRFVGKNAYFYLYALHMAVAVAVSWVGGFSYDMLQCLLVFVLSFIVYEIAFLTGKLLQRKKS